MVARGDYIFNQYGPQINMVDASNAGQYVIKITPNTPLSTLQLEVKTYYCHKMGTPRPRFFEVFPRAAFENHHVRLVTSNKTLEELDAEGEEDDNDDEAKRYGEISLISYLEYD